MFEVPGSIYVDRIECSFSVGAIKNTNVVVN